MNRTHAILVALLAVQVVLLLVLSAGGGGIGESEPQPLVPGLKEIEPSRITVEDGEGGSVTLVHRGGAWTLADPDGYPADGGRIADLLDDMAEIRVRTAVVSSDRYHDTLQVSEDEFERRIRIWDRDGNDPVLELYLGSSPNYRVHHVRVAGDDRVYEQRRITPHDLRTEAGTWVVQDLLDLPAGAVVDQVRLENGHGRFEILLSEDETWRWGSPPPVSDPPDRSTVDSWVRSLVTLRMNEPAGPADDAVHGYEAPAAVLELRYRFEEPVSTTAPVEGGEDGAADPPERWRTAHGRFRIVVGAGTADGGGRYARVDGSPFSVVLGNWDAGKMVDKKAEDLPAAES